MTVASDWKLPAERVGRPAPADLVERRAQIDAVITADPGPGVVVSDSSQRASTKAVTRFSKSPGIRRPHSSSIIPNISASDIPQKRSTKFCGVISNPDLLRTSA